MSFLIPNSSGSTAVVRLRQALEGAAPSAPGLRRRRSAALQNFTAALSLVGIGWVALFGAAAASAQTATIAWKTVYQRIDGFGASSAFLGRTWSDAQADTFFSTTNGIGLSLLRNRVKPDGSVDAGEIGLMQKAVARGARVWSAPWSPPAAYKDNNNVIGGNFVSANNQAYADLLANYAVTMKQTYGVPIYAISIQNEPDWSPTSYDGCTWTAQQIHDFVPYLYNALQAKGAVDTRVMLPESLHWQSTQTSLPMINTTLNDPAVAPMVGIVANHNYDGPASGIGATFVPAELPHTGKALWETEVMVTDPFDAGMTNALYWARRIHLFLTAAQVNAWHYWWLVSLSPDNQGLEGIGDVPTKRMYVVGQYSRFVRPGYYRIGATNTGTALISAYKDPAAGGFAIVAVNDTAAPITQTFALQDFQTDAVTPWITNDAQSLAAQPPIAVGGSSFTATLPANSVVTFVGRDTTPAPPLSSSRIINLSIRSTAGTDTATLIAGFVVVGGTKPLLIRGAGPALAPYVDGALAQPQLGLYVTSTKQLLASNAGWDTAANKADVASTAAAVGAFPFAPGAADSALLTTLPEGVYSAQITGAGGTTGIALAEIYDAAAHQGGRLVNVSARTQVGTGSGVLIAGFAIDGSEPKTLLIRAVGPTLRSYGLSAVLGDPQLTVYAMATNQVVATNTGWTARDPADIAGVGQNVGAFALSNDSTDSALLVTLPPGLYSAKVASAGTATGIALIEVYEVR